MPIDIDALPTLQYEELEEVCLLIDWRDDEAGIVSVVSDVLRPEDALEAVEHEDDEGLSVVWRGSEYVIPLTITPHDRYVAISSLAWILRNHYQFWLLKDSIDGSDTHALLILPLADSHRMEAERDEWVKDKLVKLQLGHDYFNGLAVPYTDHEDNNPDFEAQAAAQREQQEQVKPLIEQAVKQSMNELGLKPGFALDIAMKAQKRPWWKFW